MKRMYQESVERRLYERRPCSRMVDINDSGKSYSGLMRNLTMGGAFIESREQNESQIGQELMLTIPFGLKSDYLTLKAKVARIKPNGIGVRFITPVPEHHFFR